MPKLTRRQTLTRTLTGALAAATLGGTARAAPRRYAIIPEDAEIRFIFTANGTEQIGVAPLLRADLRIDPDNLTASTAQVDADVSQARAGLIMITQALKGPDILDTARHPTARFRSTGVTLGATGRLSDGATITGDLTLKGATRPVRFDAAIYRAPGSSPDDLDRLEAHLTGRISRGSFGIAGYSAMVDDTVGLDIRVRIRATE